MNHRQDKQTLPVATAEAPANRKPAVTVAALVKRYAGEPPVTALDGIDLTIAAGEIYALLGPNGAGKTTLLSILTTLSTPTAGVATVAGFDVVQEPAAVRRRIAVTFQELVVDADLTGRQTLRFHGELYGMQGAELAQRIAEMAALVELTDVLDRRSGAYSGGMKRRLELARGLLTGPQVLFLDEPTQGLDPQNRAAIWRYIRQLRDERGVTVLLTTHYMEEAEALADRVGIIHHGRMVAEGTPAALIGRLGGDVVTLVVSGDVAALESALAQLPFVVSFAAGSEGEARRLQVGVDDGERRLTEIIALALAHRVRPAQINVTRPGLGDVFLAVTGEGLGG